jgi:DNA repair exonuclease SbcCD ATPase subunit
MTDSKRLRGAAAAVALACAGTAAAAQDDDPFTTPEEVRTEISEAMDAIADYSAQERDAALAEAREALDRIDAEIERREQALRENWADMSESARDAARESLRDLREARNRLGERYGALQAGASGAWTELREGFTDAWDAFSGAWDTADEDANGN